MIHAHDAATPLLDRLRPDYVAAVLGTVAIVAFLLGPRAAPGLLFMLAAVPAIALARGGWPAMAAAMPHTRVLAASFAFGVYLVINASWSANPGHAYGKVLFYWIAVLLVCAAVAGLARLDSRLLQRWQRAVLAAAAIGGVVLLIEVLSGCLMARTLFSLVPFTRPDPKHIEMAGESVTAIEPYMLNRNVAALCFVLWPALLMLRTLAGARQALWIGLPALAATAVAVLGSDHATSAIALALASLTFLAMMLAAPLARRLIAAAWIAAVLFVVPLASWAFASQLQFATWLPETARNRIILWGYTASQIKQAPLLGVGVASTREIDAARQETIVRPDGYTYPLRTGRHAHNIFLQTWYELGAIGAVLLLGLGLAGIEVLARLPAADQPLAFAGFVTVVTTGASSWGMWQTWFMAAYGIWVLLLALAVEGARRQRCDQV